MEKSTKETSLTQKANVINLSEKKEENLITLLAEIIVEKTIKKLDHEKSNYIFKNIYRQAK
jgi:hypothetical protein